MNSNFWNTENKKVVFDENQQGNMLRGYYIKKLNDRNIKIRFAINKTKYKNYIKNKNVITRMKNEITRMKNEIYRQKKINIEIEKKYNDLIEDNKRDIIIKNMIDDIENNKKFRDEIDQKYNDVMEEINIYANITVIGVFKVSKTIIRRNVNINQYLIKNKYNIMKLDNDIIRGCILYGENFGADFMYYENKQIDYFTQRQIALLLNQRMLKSTNIHNIANLYNHEIDLNENECCVLDVLIDNYKKYHTKKTIINKMNEITGFKSYRDYKKYGISSNDLIKFCQMCEIGLYIYDVNANLIYSRITQHQKKNLIIITHNNHMYVAKNKTLERQRIKKIKTEDIKYIYETKNDVKNALIEKIENNECVTYVNISKNSEILGFKCNDIYYLMKDVNFNNINNILNKYGLGELNKNHEINTNNIFSTIETLYLHTNINHFMPINYSMPPVHYTSEEKYFKKNKEVRKIDKNKCYASACAQLEYLIIADYMTCDINKCNNDVDIVDHYYYLITPNIKQENKLWFVLVDEKSNIYNGSYIKMLRKNNINFDIIEQMTTEKINNHYKKMFEDMFNDTTKFTKDELTILKLGYCVQFEKENRAINYKDKIVYNNINSKDTDTGFDIQLTKDITVNYSKIEKIDVEFKNRKLINNQIKTYARQSLYNKLIELKLELSDIIEMNTDSITFYYNENVHIYNANEYNKTDFYGWKTEENDIIDNQFKTTYKKNYITESLEIPTLYTQIMEIKNSQLNIGYAGSGKSYLIEREIEKNPLHQIITPNHFLNSGYKTKNLNSKVIQYYVYNPREILKIDKNTIIYIDEIGLYDKMGWQIIIKLILLNYNVKLYGDYSQISPWDSKNESAYDKKHFINTLFPNVKILNTNSRNFFTKSYYNSLIQSNDKEYLYNEIVKYQEKDYKKASLIVSYYKQTCDYYNELMLIHIYNNNKKYSNIGEKLICMTNDLKNIEIYNNSILYIDKIDDEHTYIKHLNDDKIFKLKHNQVKNNFKNAYCININKIQGQNLKSYYFANKKDYQHMIKTTDKNQICKDRINSKMAYTIISRISKPYEQVKPHWENNTFDDAPDMNQKYIQEIYKRDIQNIKIRYNGDIKNDNNTDDNDTWDDMFN
jgi:hypothetical protein